MVRAGPGAAALRGLRHLTLHCHAAQAPRPNRASVSLPGKARPAARVCRSPPTGCHAVPIMPPGHPATLFKPGPRVLQPARNSGVGGFRLNCQRRGALTRANSPHARDLALGSLVARRRSLVAQCQVRSAAWSPATCVARPQSGRMAGSAALPQRGVVASARAGRLPRAMPPCVLGRHGGRMVATGAVRSCRMVVQHDGPPGGGRRVSRSATRMCRLAGGGWWGAATAGTGG
jgi:hypothetical protein